MRARRGTASAPALLALLVAISLTACSTRSPSSDTAGVGLALRRTEAGRVEIERPLHASAACDLAIHSGDRLVSVAGKPVGDAPLEEIAESLAGPAGTEVTLTVASAPDFAARTVTAIRRRASLVAVESSILRPGVGYVRIHYFVSGVAARIESAVRALDPDALTGLVVDLRDNSGGLLDDVVESAGLFLPAGATVGFVLDREGTRTLRSSRTTPGPFERLRRAVVVNGLTASGAELFAAALAADGSSVGSPTQGAGDLERVYRGPGGEPATEKVGELADWRGRPLGESGLVPDLAAADRPNASCSGAHGESLDLAAEWLLGPTPE